MTQAVPQTSLDFPASAARPHSLVFQPVPPVGWNYPWRQSLTALPLIAGDLTAVALSAAGAVAFSGSVLGWSLGFEIVFLGLSTLTGFHLLGLYPAIGIHPANEMKRVLTLIGLICACLLFTSFQRGLPAASSLWALVLLWGLWSVSASAARPVVRSLFSRFDWWTQPVIFLGAGPRYQILSRDFQRHRSQGLRPVGYFNDSRQHWLGDAVDESDFLGDRNDAAEYARRHNIFWVVVLEPPASQADDDEGFDSTCYTTIPHRLFQRWADEFHPSIWDDLFTLERHSFIHQTDKLLLPHNLWFKRFADLVATAFLTVLTAPAVLLIAIIVKLTSQGPVFYRSDRVGVNGQRFAMTKFRTMRQDSESYLQRYLERHPERREEWNREQKLKNDPRVTWIGKILRRTSLDELPQIYDVVLGKMSLVGPRPMLLNEPELYGAHFQSFCRMLPGMTGLWQVSGRNRISHDQRKILVSYYVQNWSPWLDLYLVAKTIKVVITGDGAY